MIYNLLDLYEVKSGIGNKSRDDFDESKFEYKIIMFKEIFFNSKLPDKDNLKTTVNLKPGELERFNIKKGDILLTSSSETMNELAMSSVAYEDYHNTVYSGFSKRLRPKTNLTILEFMRYWFRSEKFRNEIDKTVTMTTRANLNLSILRSIEVSLPSIKKQKVIANILSSLDDRIELNNKINDNLETLAQILYKHWFVHFEFPNEKGEPYRTSDGEMVNSELGLIPKGWEVKELKDIFEFTGGFSFKGNREESKHKYKIITIKNVQDGFMDFSKVSSIEKLPEKVRKDQFLKLGDILVSLTGTVVGRTCLVNQTNCLLNQRVEKIMVKDTFLNGFCYFYFRNKDTYNKLLSLGKGSAQQNLSPVEVSKLKIALPVNEKKLFIVFDNFVNLVLNKQIQNNRLAELRDLLLPKLMSGEIEVPAEE